MKEDIMLFMSRKDIIQLLKSAFEEGWSGYLDLRDATAESLLEDYLNKATVKEVKEYKKSPCQEIIVDNQNFGNEYFTMWSQATNNNSDYSQAIDTNSNFSITLTDTFTEE
jgi:hypothetical protein